jgi:hypothetical protein
MKKREKVKEEKIEKVKDRKSYFQRSVAEMEIRSFKAVL